MYDIIDINFLKPIEMVFKYHLKNLSDSILSTGILNVPVIVDKVSGAVLDGSHRYVFFLQNGYTDIPVKFVEYSDENIRVGSLLIHRFLVDKHLNISKKEVIDRAKSGNLFPPRTTRHFFPFRKNEYINFKIDDLDRGVYRNVDHLILNSDVNDEIDMNTGYLNEIEVEFDELIKYMEELRQTKEYIKLQVKSMRNYVKI